jgi:hypothetical protein
MPRGSDLEAGQARRVTAVGHDALPSLSPAGPLAIATGPGERAHYPSTPNCRFGGRSARRAIARGRHRRDPEAPAASDVLAGVERVGLVAVPPVEGPHRPGDARNWRRARPAAASPGRWVVVRSATLRGAWPTLARSGGWMRQCRSCRASRFVASPHSSVFDGLRPAVEHCRMACTATCWALDLLVRRYWWRRRRRAGPSRAPTRPPSSGRGP